MALERVRLEERAGGPLGRAASLRGELLANRCLLSCAGSCVSSQFLKWNGETFEALRFDPQHGQFRSVYELAGTSYAVHSNLGVLAVVTDDSFWDLSGAAPELPPAPTPGCMAAPAPLP